MVFYNIGMKMRLFISLLFICFQAIAANIATECDRYEHGFCLMKDSDIKNANEVVIYLRGHWDFRGYVPTPQWESSIEQVIPYYGLLASKNELGLPFLISSSSHLSFDTEILEGFGIDSSKELILASHSGGYHGLLNSLSKLKNTDYKVKKIIMLDNFYFGAASTPLIKHFVDHGSECNGFYTQHNEERYTERFKSTLNYSLCPIQKKTQHNLTVNKCLTEYVLGESC
jgi:hypothetical protein